MHSAQIHYLNSFFEMPGIDVTTVEYPSDIHGGIKICYRIDPIHPGESEWHRVTEMDIAGRITRAANIGE